MIYSTKGIVLRTVKYGETSVIASVLTEMFGIQSYIVNGVRTFGKTGKAHLFQPSSILEMEVYHSELKNLQRIKDLRWNVLYKNILSNITKNAVALFMVEILQKSLKQPEVNEPLFQFCEAAFIELDTADAEVTANFPLYFSIQLAPFLGFRLHNNYSEKRNKFNFAEGNFSEENSFDAGNISADTAFYISELLKAIHPNDLHEIKMNKKHRGVILRIMENYYAWHIPEFGKMKTLDVLSEIL